MIVCPVCKGGPTNVVQTIAFSRSTVKRRRKCPRCRLIFSTLEVCIMDGNFKDAASKIEKTVNAINSKQ